MGEPELDRAVADLDRPPSSEHARGEAIAEPSEPVAERSEPAAEPAQPAAELPVPTERPPEPEQPRRRSTVREPAAYFTGEQPSQPPSPPAQTESASQPAPAEPGEGERADQPRRTGWWARRLAGKS